MPFLKCHTIIESRNIFKIFGNLCMLLYFLFVRSFSAYFIFLNIFKIGCMNFQPSVDFGCMSPLIAAASHFSRQLSIPSFSHTMTPQKLPSHDQFCPKSIRLKAEGPVFIILNYFNIGLYGKRAGNICLEFRIYF